MFHVKHGARFHVKHRSPVHEKHPSLRTQTGRCFT